jgi:sortase A
MRWLGLFLFLLAVSVSSWVITGRRLAASARPALQSLFAPVEKARAVVGESTPRLPAEQQARAIEEAVLPAVPLATETEALIRATPLAAVDQTAGQSESSSSVKSYAIQKVIVPKLRISVQVIEAQFAEMTWDLAGLGQQVAWLRRPSADGPGNNLVLAGHVTVFNGSNGPFRYLSRLKPGDEVLVYTSDQILTYQIRESVRVYPEDVSVIEETSKPQLSLVTCIDWDENTKTYLRRLVVFGDLVNVASPPGKTAD